MDCPKCGKADLSYVKDSRRRNSSGYVLRKRVCMCGHKFNTVEVSELNAQSLEAIRRASFCNGGRKEFEQAIMECYEKLFGQENMAV